MSVSLTELDGKGQLQQEVPSPEDQYVARAYLIDDGGATVRAQVRVSITSLSGDGDFNDKTIYWEINAEDKENTEIIWENDHLLTVNNKEINIYEEDTYYNWKEHINN